MTKNTSLAKLKTLDIVLESLMRRYSERVPDVRIIIEAMVSQGIVERIDAIENDHIAFRQTKQ